MAFLPIFLYPNGEMSLAKSTHHDEQGANLLASQVINRIQKRLIPIEVFAIFTGSLLATSIRFQQGIWESISEYPGQPKVLLYPLLWYYCMYRNHGWDRSIIHLSRDFYTRVLISGWYALLSFAAVAFLLKYPISRIWVITNAIVVTAILILNRYLLRVIYSRLIKEPTALSYLYIGAKSGQGQCADEFQSVYGFTPTFKQFNPPKGEDSGTWLQSYLDIVNRHRVFGTVIGVGAIQDATLLRVLADTNREQVIDLLIETKIGAISNRFEKLDTANLVRLQESALTTSGAVLKRIFDIFFSATMLILLAPIFLVVATAIKINSVGPIFYIDKRVGKDGLLFTFPKFRSMYVGSDSKRLEVLGRPDDKMADRYKSDPRITSVGRFIRRWSIDELPQFWCVLIGTMSAVGPRPILREELVQIPNTSLIRFMAKPGLTGLWQVSGRKEVAWNDRLIRDITYIDNWSLSEDLFLIWKTIGVIIKGQGAH